MHINYDNAMHLPKIERKNKKVVVTLHVRENITPSSWVEYDYEVTFDFSSSELNIYLIPQIKRRKKSYLSNEGTTQLKEKYVLDYVNSSDEMYVNCSKEIFNTKIK